jgi:hypothetical protein
VRVNHRPGPVSQIAGLLRCFLVAQNVAAVFGARGINRHISFVYVLNDSVLIDDKRSPITVATFLVKDPVIFDYRSLEIAEKRESNAILFAEFTIGGNAVYADSKNLCVGTIEFGDISLIRLHFLRSTTGESQYVERQHDILLSLEVTELITD